MTEEPAPGPGAPAEPSAEAPGVAEEPEGPQAATGPAEPPPERPSLRATLAQRWKLAAAVLPALGFGLAVARYYQGCQADQQAQIDDTWSEVRAASERPEDLSRTANIRERIEALHREGESFGGLNIENFRLRDADLAGANFSETSGANADFAGARLAGADFSGAFLTGPDFTNADLEEALFEGAELPGAVFADAILTGAAFRGAILREATFVRATLAGADLTDAELAGAAFRGAILSAAGTDTPPALLPERLQCVDLSDADLAGTDLSETVFLDSSLAGACLAGAQLQGASFTYTDVTGGDFSGAFGLAAAALAAACIQEGGDPPLLPEGLRWAGRDCGPLWEVRRGDNCRMETRPPDAPARECASPEPSADPTP